MRHGKTTHNIYVNQREYNELGKKYPTGKYTRSETLNWFTIEIAQVDALSNKGFSVEIIFWRTE